MLQVQCCSKLKENIKVVITNKSQTQTQDAQFQSQTTGARNHI